MAVMPGARLVLLVKKHWENEDELVYKSWGSTSVQDKQQTLSAMERLETRQLLSADAGGNSLAAATSLGAINGTRVINDSVSAADSNDYYRIQVAQQSDVRLDLTGMRADADLQWLNSSERSLGRSATGGGRSESLSQTLSAGTYFVRVYRYSGDTNYSLSIRVQPIVITPPDSAGNSISAARPRDADRFVNLLGLRGRQ